MAKFHESLECFEKQRKIKINRGVLENDLEMCYLLHNIGYIKTNLDQYGEASKNLEKSLGYLKEKILE